MASRYPLGSETLRYRRQFVLGPDFADLLSGWQRHRVADQLAATVHPALPYVRVDDADRSLVLLGYVIDPRRPERNETAVLQDILRRSSSFSGILEAFDPFAGRWAGIYLADNTVRVFHDAAGLRSVYHTLASTGPVWCASTPGLLARVTDSPEDVDHRDELVRAGVFDRGTNHFWPGSGSSFLGISRLLPNHFLELHTGRVERYWPTSPIPPSDPVEAVARCADTLSGVLTAAAARYPLALAMTAGIDSRLLLAASRGSVDRLTFHTLKKTGMTSRSPDICVPRKMLRNLGLTHKVIPVQRCAKGVVAETVRQTFFPCHQQTADQVAAVFADPPRTDAQWVTVNGNVSEIARSYYARLAFTPENLAISIGMSKSAYPAEALSSWLEAAVPAIESSGIDPWDLFYWEHKMGGWLATVRAEFDVVEEAVTPYNSRTLLVDMLGVDASLRAAPDHAFQRDLIRYMWPELLDYPINPPARLAPLRRGYRSARSLARQSVAKVLPARRRTSG